MLPDTDDRCNRLCEQLRVGERSQLDVPDSVAEAIDDPRSGVERETGLADPAGAEQRHETLRLKQTADLFGVQVAPDDIVCL